MPLPHDSPTRQKAFAWLENVKSNLPLNSKEDALYAQFTGNNQDFFLRHWATPGDRTTGCNGFTATYAKSGLGGPYVGGFFMDTEAPKAWIKNTGDNAPRYGDIALQADRGHVFVVLDTDPPTSIQAGFNGSWHKTGPGRDGTDVIGVGKYDPANVLGWLDIDLLVPPRQAVPQWVKGWWLVTWDEDVYYYYFANNWTVTWTYISPYDYTSLTLPTDGGLGNFHLTGGLLQVNWFSGSVEQYWYGAGDESTLEFWGKHNGQGVLHVERLWGVDPA
jgi:hypothetical protein